MKKLNNLRPISAYSNPDDTSMDYRKEYWFHHWIKPGVGLIEDEEGKLHEAACGGNWKFKESEEKYLRVQFPVVKSYNSENYALIIEDSAGITHYWHFDGSYDGWAGNEGTCFETQTSKN